MTQVFISYTHDSEEHKARVLALAERLRGDGLYVIMDSDQMPGGPDKGWDTWSEQQAEHAERVLLVITASYRQCWDGEQPSGMREGATYEASVLKRRIVKQGAVLDFCRPVVFDATDTNHIPYRIAGLHSYTLQRDYPDIVGWLRGVAAVQSAPAGSFVWPAPIPNYHWPLADRKEEFALFARMLSGASVQRILLVKGNRNTGKSLLLQSLREYTKQLRLPVARIDLKGCPSKAELFGQLRLALRKSLPEPAFDAAAPLRLVEHLQELNAPLALLFDTYEHASDEVRDWLQWQLLNHLEDLPGVVAAVSGQVLPEPDKNPWRSLTTERELTPIERADDWLDYVHNELGCSVLTSKDMQLLISGALGNPGMMDTLLVNVVQKLKAGASL